jgi:LCP family protein required for cell wall assembly
MVLFGGRSKRRFNVGKKKVMNKGRIALVISLALCFCIAVGFFYLSSQIKPPEIPTIAGSAQAVIPEPEQRQSGGSAFYPGEHNEEDAQIGDGLIAPEGVTDDDRKEGFYTFLILGLDEGVNTDTIMVASYDAVNKEANIISIPRDSLVNVSRRTKKINMAYPAGFVNGGGRLGGVEQMKREVRTIIGFVPDFYITIDLTAFVKFIDAVGGVEVHVPFHMKYVDPYQNLNIDIRSGTQVLNGEQALQFARYRLGAPGHRSISDYQRIENQQAVIKAVLERLLQPANLLKIPEFIQIFSDNVFTELDAGNLVWFAGQLNSIRGADALSTYTMPTTGTSGFPVYYELLDETAVVELVNRTINPYTVDITADDLDILSRAP